MYKKFLSIALLLILLIGLVGCSNSSRDSIGDVILNSYELYIKVTDEEGNSLEGDISLLDEDSKEILDYKKYSKSAEFSDLKNGYYTLVVGREGYQAEVYNLYVDKKQTKNVILKKSNDQVVINFKVHDQDDTVLSGVDVEANSNYNSNLSEKTDINGECQLNVSRGVIYQYSFNADNYSSYQGNYLTIADKSDNFEISLSNSNGFNIDKYIFNSQDDKEISLGNVESNQEVIIGIVPLNLDVEDNSTYDATLNVEFNLDETQSMMLKAKKINQEVKVQNIDIQNNVDNTISNFAQAKFDARLRAREKELLTKNKDNSSNENISIQSLITSYKSYNIGDTREFNVSNVDNSGFKEITATMKAESTYAYVFVENSLLTDDEVMNNIGYIANKFDDIYKIDIANFAQYSVNEYDWEGNKGKKIILVTDIGEYVEDEGLIMGFFYGVDYYPKASVQESNEADMFYINSWGIKYAEGDYRIGGQEINFDLDKDILGTLAHEFQHLIYFVNRYRTFEEYGSFDNWGEETWINEGFAELAAYLNGYGNYQGGHSIEYFEDTSKESLIYWDQKLSDYGASKLFALYLYERFGKEIIEDITTSIKNPVNVISEEYRDFSDLILDWAMANYITVNGDENKTLYNYPVDLIKSVEDSNGNIIKLPIISSISSSSLDRFTIKSTAVKYYKVRGNGSEINLTIDLPEKTGVVIYRDNY
jgi:hypothetical protein